MDLAENPLYASNADRILRRAEYIAALSEATRRMRRADLLDALEAANVPAGPINTLAEAFADPQALARGMRTELPATGVRGDVAPAVRSPMLIDGAALIADRAAPLLGEHTEAVLTALGYDAGERERLRGAGVVG